MFSNYVLLIFFSFFILLYLIMCLYVLSSLLSCPLRFPHKIYVWFFFTASSLWEGASLIYVICACLRTVVSNTYCAVFLLCFPLSCVVFLALFGEEQIIQWLNEKVEKDKQWSTKHFTKTKDWVKRTHKKYRTWTHVTLRPIIRLIRLRQISTF